MKVSDLARRTGISSHRLRHYEELGLVQAARSDSGYRIFDERSLRDALFVNKCREVGVSLKIIGELLPSYRSGKLTYDQMIDLMNARIREVDRQIDEQREIRAALVAAAAWFQKKKVEAEQRRLERARQDTAASRPWPTKRKINR